MIEVAVIYCRKSDPSAKSNDPAFEQQEAACRTYCEEKGYVVLVARREAYTGTDLANQQMLWDCIEDVKRGHARMVVAYSYDRLSRDPQMQEVALYEIETKYGGQFEAATEQIDHSDPFRQAFRNMLAAASSVERRRAVGRMQRGKIDRAQRGALYGCPNAKFGYRWADDTPGGHTRYVVDVDNAHVVRRIFDWMDQGKGLRFIARQLNAERVPTPSQVAALQGHIGERRIGDTWRHAGLIKMLRDPAYCGRMEAYKRQSSHSYVKNPNTGILEKKLMVTVRAPSERIALPETVCPALVPVDQWERVQAISQSNKSKDGRPPLDPELAILRGHVYCKCGRRMGLALYKKGIYQYRCNNNAGLAPDPSRACPYGHQAVRASVVNDFVLCDVSKVLAEKGVLREYLESKKTNPRALRLIVEDLTVRITKKTADRESFLMGIGESKSASVIAALVEKADACAQEINDATEKLAEARLRLVSIDQHNADFDLTITLLEQWPAGALFDQPPEQRRRLFRQIGLHVEVAPAGTLGAHAGAARLSAKYAVQEDRTERVAIFSMIASAT